MTDRARLTTEFFENAPVMFSCYDENLCMTELNQTTLRFLHKKDKSEVIGLHLEEISPGIRATGRLEQYASVAKTGRPLYLRSVVTVPELGSKEVGTYAFPLGKGFAIIALDVSDWVSQERTMIAKLEQQNKELEQFAYVASHDLQEPLETVSSFVGVLKKKYSGRLDDKADTYIEFIVQASRRMQTLVRNLLDYSRIGKTDRHHVVDCAALVAEVLADMDATLQSTGATVRVQPLPEVQGNATELKQLFQNLVGNAVKFRRGEPPVVDISAVKEDRFWKFFVSDNGIGIEEKFYERIFVIFQRLHNRSQYEGTGIGLSLCKKIVEMHGGQMGLKSRPGEGTTFYFTLKTPV